MNQTSEASTYDVVIEAGRIAAAETAWHETKDLSQMASNRDVHQSVKETGDDSGECYSDTCPEDETNTCQDCDDTEGSPAVSDGAECDDTGAAIC